METTTSMIAIRRDERFSPGTVEKDEAILQAVVSRLGGTVKVIDEARLTEADQADVYLSMGRLPQTLSLLGQKEAQGARVLNRSTAVAACARRRITETMRANGIPMPPVRGDHGYWLKRGDGAAQSKTDIVFCRDEQEVAAARRDFSRRGIEDVVVSANVEGDLVKFYCVGTSFFRWFWVDSPASPPAFDAAALHRTACRLASLIGIEVFGGDCIVSADGTLSIIDFNDWPSFSWCRDEAAEAIHRLLTDEQL